ncbi:M48 family metallopeptidase [Catalinimonas niigatensis]|uniref:M48 family metallopeptidase n=1 Tax=Catalinimonas niigatensis TaxID=1397264 RepID=UPI00266717B3|nr:M48 family metallopeptidase [Catalinimonas niigatensis]WPP48545.1 M48 family metallopeptidase [Catalinimonas niigatensis]
MNASTLLLIILAIVTLNFLLEQILNALNRKNKKHALPDELKGIYDEEKYYLSLNYQRTNDRFHTLTSTFSFVLSIILLSTGFFGWLDIQLQPYVEDPLWRALAYFGILFLASDMLTIPFQLYGTFVIEEKFGFNKMDFKTFWLDKLKGYLLTAILGGLLVGVFLYLVMNIGKDFWWYFWAIAAVVMVLLNMFYTSIFVPMFNKLRPLEEGALREEIEAYGRKVDFPIKNVYVIDGSKRSSKSNAFFSGLGRQKKVVLYDTLIENHSVEELVAVIAHEVGHYKKKHILSGMLLSILQIGFTLFVLSRLIFNEQLSYALGADTLSIHINLIAFGILFSPISTITGLLMNLWSRKNEYEADAYAASTYEGNALATALKKLSVHNMSNLLPHPWYVFFHYSHPPLLARLRAIIQPSTAQMEA